MAPAVGFEPTTKWLTATYSTAELCRSVLIETYYIIHFANCKSKSEKKSKKIDFFAKSYLFEPNYTLSLLYIFPKNRKKT